MNYLQSSILIVSIVTAQSAFGNDAYDAWEAGQYDEALQGFLDQQMENPNNRDLGMNVGSAHYMLGDFDKAATQFDLLTQKGTPKERSEAFYNLGNTKYRQGKLDEALQAYQKTVELNPDDKDANFNLEFVRDEIRRRHEEAQKNQEQNPNQNQQNQEQQEQNGEQSQDEQSQEEPQNSMSDDPEHARESEEPDAPQNANPEEDGATDQPEANPEPQSGEEPTPEEEGQEGSAAQSQDGDQAESEQGQSQEESAAGQDGTQTGQEQALTPEEAQRYLDALDPDRPPTQKRARKGRRSRKDW